MMSGFFWRSDSPTSNCKSIASFAPSVFHTHPALPGDQLSTFSAISKIWSTSTDNDFIMIIFVICIMIIVLMMTIILMMQQKHASELYEVKNRLDMPSRVLYQLNPLSTETHMLLHNDLVQRNPALIGFINNHSTRFPSSPIALTECLRFQEMSVQVERSRHQWSLTKLYTWISQWFYWWNVSLELLGRSRTTTSLQEKTARWHHWRRHTREW